ncbi:MULTISPECIES: GGDEF domain-containing protein [Methylobacterium]|uniref:GGDEF domain-containing protein n=1 Tax=Methylobacterium TaxID=407 RepID=UPI0013EBC63F|nr:diguanylate cyclase [Methylobacterium sp. DB0501]NGM36385.1 GGDEF domain-containing protein [Methylobacterium sp. DB0501]
MASATEGRISQSNLRRETFVQLSVAGARLAVAYDRRERLEPPLGQRDAMVGSSREPPYGSADVLSSVEDQIRQLGVFRRLRAPWEGRYLAAAAEKRSKLIRIYAILAAIVYVICIGIDLANLSNPVAAVCVRLLGAVFCATLAVSMRWTLIQNHGGLVVIAVAAAVMLTGGYLGRFGSVEINLLYNIGSLMGVLLAVIGIPLSLRTTTATTMFCLIAYAAFTLENCGTEFVARLSAIGYFSSMVVAGLVLKLTIETNERHRFLLQVRDDVQRRQLIEAGNALSIANAQLARVALTDGLTGIANRRRFDDGLSEAWCDALENGGGLGLVLIDVDHFKRYNDHYGHPAGDACLRAVAEALSAEVRTAQDLVARYGGEEFVVLLRGGDVGTIARRLVACIERFGLPHAHRADDMRIVTISAGCALARPRDGMSAADLLAAADAALYAAKQAGRNRAVVQGGVGSGGRARGRANGVATSASSCAASGVGS